MITKRIIKEVEASDFFLLEKLTKSILDPISKVDVIISKGDANYRRFFEDRKNSDCWC